MWPFKRKKEHRVIMSPPEGILNMELNIRVHSITKAIYEANSTTLNPWGLLNIVEIKEIEETEE